jgi:hypothetical protein
METERGDTDPKIGRKGGSFEVSPRQEEFVWLSEERRFSALCRAFTASGF